MLPPTNRNPTVKATNWSKHFGFLYHRSRLAYTQLSNFKLESTQAAGLLASASLLNRRLHMVGCCCGVVCSSSIQSGLHCSTKVQTTEPIHMPVDTAIVFKRNATNWTHPGCCQLVAHWATEAPAAKSPWLGAPLFWGASPVPVPTLCSASGCCAAHQCYGRPR